MTLSVEDKYTIRLLVQFKREEIADLTFCYRVVFGLCIDSEDFFYVITQLVETSLLKGL